MLNALEMEYTMEPVTPPPRATPLLQSLPGAVTFQSVGSGGHVAPGRSKPLLLNTMPLKAPLWTMASMVRIALPPATGTLPVLVICF